MDPTLIFTAIGQAFALVKSIGLSILNLLSKKHVDKIELAKMEYEYKIAVQNLDYALKQASLQIQQSLINLEKDTGAKWRTPLILASGGAIIFIAINNVLASCYLTWATPIDVISKPIGLLAGMFLLLVTGNSSLFLSTFAVKVKNVAIKSLSILKRKGK